MPHAWHPRHSTPSLSPVPVPVPIPVPVPRPATRSAPLRSWRGCRCATAAARASTSLSTSSSVRTRDLAAAAGAVAAAGVAAAVAAAALVVETAEEGGCGSRRSCRPNYWFWSAAGEVGGWLDGWADGRAQCTRTPYRPTPTRTYDTRLLPSPVLLNHTILQAYTCTTHTYKGPSLAGTLVLTSHELNALNSRLREAVADCLLLTRQVGGRVGRRVGRGCVGHAR